MKECFTLLRQIMQIVMQKNMQIILPKDQVVIEQLQKLIHILKKFFKPFNPNKNLPEKIKFSGKWNA